jgi:His-Xaa-Ser system protein HxsD
MGTTEESRQSESVIVRFDRALFSEESVLKACYWLTRDYCCEVNRDSVGSIEVTMGALGQASACDLAAARSTLIQNVEDFELREKISARTSGIRDLLLAKAFSESGVLEDSPEGVFGDRIENEKPNGMFKILSNS